jgi:hypothetical protein
LKRRPQKKLLLLFITALITASVITGKRWLLPKEKSHFYNKSAWLLPDNRLLVLNNSQVFAYDFKEKQVTEVFTELPRDRSVVFSRKAELIDFSYPYIVFLEEKRGKTPLCYLTLFNIENRQNESLLLEKEPASIKFIPQSHTLIALYNSGLIQKYSYPNVELTGAFIISLPAGFNIKGAATIAQPDNKLILSSKKMLTQIDIRNNRPVSTLFYQNNNQKFRTLTASSDGKFLASVYDKKLMLKEFSHNQPQAVLLKLTPQQNRRQILLKFSGDNRHLMVLNGNNLLMIDADKREILWQRRFPTGKHGPITAAFSADGTLLAIGGSQLGQVGAVFIYDVQSGQLKERVLGANDA